MWKICGYEIYKLYKNKLFLFITVVLLGGNLLYAYAYGRNVAEYQEPEEYETLYVTFVQEMTERAARILERKTYAMFKDADIIGIRTTGEFSDGVYRFMLVFSNCPMRLAFTESI